MEPEQYHNIRESLIDLQMPPDAITKEWARILEAKSPLEVLGFFGIPDSRDKITSAYRRLARTLHPDVIRKLPENWRDYANQAMGKINQAYKALESQELFFGETIPSLESKPPLEQLVLLLKNLSGYGIRNGATDYVNPLFSVGLIQSYLNEIFIIQKAYSGDVHYHPKEGSLPGINEVLSVLKEGRRIETSITRLHGPALLEETVMPSVDFEFYVPNQLHSRDDVLSRKATSYYWPSRFIELNRLPTIMEAEKRRLELERTTKYGRALGWVVNRINPVVVDINTIDRNLQYGQTNRQDDRKGGELPIALPNGL